MAGGLMQLAVYGSQDIFLTGTPQITFFKVVHRRYTNFAIESIHQDFIGMVNFGQEMSSVIEKSGDLMGRVYLEVEIPKVNLIKSKSSPEQIKQKYQLVKKYYQLSYDYISKNIDVAKKINLLVSTNNISIDDVEDIVNNKLFYSELRQNKNYLIDFLLSNESNLINEIDEKRSSLINSINQIDIVSLFFNIIETSNERNIQSDEKAILKKNRIQKLIKYALYPPMREYYQDVFSLYQDIENKYYSVINGTYLERYQFAWVEELGHAMIDYIDIYIGSQMIDKHTGDWLILFNKIFLREYQMENYDKMIGNIPELTILNDSIKDNYILTVPFQFWFCRNTGLSLPLVSLRYHDIMFTVKLKDLSKLCYVGNDPETPNITELQSQYNINIINARLYVDYIYLDSDERRRFAQSTHEYLIETVQYNDFDNIYGEKAKVSLNFAHATKFIIWFVQPHFYRENPTGRNKCQWNNFGTRPDKTGYTMNSAFLRINYNNLTDPDLDIKYYNYLQPYWYFIHSPTDGYNVYSFAIKPMEHQPSSSINMSRIDDFSIKMAFSKEFINLVNRGTDGTESRVYMAAYVMSYNVLRIMSGMGGLAFQNST